MLLEGQEVDGCTSVPVDGRERDGCTTVPVYGRERDGFQLCCWVGASGMAV